MTNDWEKIEKEAKLRKSLRERFKLLGKRVRRYGEEGVIVISSLKPKPKYRDKVKIEPEYFIMFSDDDCEQLIGLPFEICEDGRFISDSDDITKAHYPFNLTDEELDFLGLSGPDTILKKI
jgi:hypothetical protein